MKHLGFLLKESYSEDSNKILSELMLLSLGYTLRPQITVDFFNNKCQEDEKKHFCDRACHGCYLDGKNKASVAVILHVEKLMSGPSQPPLKFEAFRSVGGNTKPA